MTVLIVNLVGLALIALIVWYFWLSKPNEPVRVCRRLVYVSPAVLAGVFWW